MVCNSSASGVEEGFIHEHALVHDIGGDPIASIFDDVRVGCAYPFGGCEVATEEKYQSKFNASSCNVISFFKIRVQYMTVTYIELDGSCCNN